MMTVANFYEERGDQCKHTLGAGCLNAIISIS